MSIQILIVDDEPDICELLQEILEEENYKVLTAHNAKTARPLVKSMQLDLVLLDIWMPGEDGVSLLKEWKKSFLKNVPVIMMSGHGTVETAVQATRYGAEDFIEKPISMARLLTTVSKCLERIGKQASKPIKQLQTVSKSDFVGNSPTIEDLREKATIAALQKSHILLTGETGAGKRQLAKVVHKVASTEGRFVELDPSVLVDDRCIVSLLGEQTNDGLTEGLLDKARMGSLYVEDITRLPALFCKALLRVIEAGSYSPLGSTKKINLECRLIFASSESIQNSEKLKAFRQELFYCTSIISLHVPSLRDRAQDIPAFLDYFVDYFVEQKGLNYRHFAVDVQNYLRNYSWPGNVAELKNFVQRVLMFGKDEEVLISEVENLLVTLEQKDSPGDFAIPLDMTLREARDLFEKTYLETVLKRVNGSVSKLAEVSGMERTHLYRKLKSLGITSK